MSWFWGGVGGNVWVKHLWVSVVHHHFFIALDGVFLESQLQGGFLVTLWKGLCVSCGWQSRDSLSVGYDLFKYVNMIFVDTCNKNIYIWILSAKQSGLDKYKINKSPQRGFMAQRGKCRLVCNWLLAPQLGDGAGPGSGLRAIGHPAICISLPTETLIWGLVVIFQRYTDVPFKRISHFTNVEKKVLAKKATQSSLFRELGLSLDLIFCLFLSCVTLDKQQCCWAQFSYL